MVPGKEFMEIAQLRLGEVDKEQAAGQVMELPVPVQYFLAERDSAVTGNIFDQHMDIRGQQAVSVAGCR